MKLLRDTFRIWWQKPAAVADRKEEREISFLELFYDLVYVAIVIQLTHVVAGHVSGETILQYIVLFAMVWWAWINGSLYHEIHGNNDIRTRIFTFLQMISLAGMGIFIHSAFGEGYQGFAISYSLFLSILTYLWWRTGIYDPEHRPLAMPYVYGFCCTTILFIISVFTDKSISYILWGIAIIFSLILPLILQVVQREVNQEHHEAAMKISPSFAERIGLLTIIILGEAVISTVGGAAHIENMYLVHVLSVIGIFGIIISVWWIYFDFIARRLPIQKTFLRLSWIYLHLFLTMSIGLLSAGILNAIEYVEVLEGIDRVLFITPLILFLLSIILLMKTLDIKERFKPVYNAGAVASGAAIIILMIISQIEMGKTTTILCIAMTLFIPVVAAFFTWIKKIQ